MQLAAASAKLAPSAHASHQRANKVRARSAAGLCSDDIGNVLLQRCAMYAADGTAAAERQQGSVAAAHVRQ
jgi:hypothetical protein